MLGWDRSGSCICWPGKLADSFGGVIARNTALQQPRPAIEVDRQLHSAAARTACHVHQARALMPQPHPAQASSVTHTPQ